MTSVKEVSKAIIQKSSGPVSNLKLQKLLYYVQGWSLAMREAPAFYEEVQAWVHGPVVPAAFDEYKHYRWNSIDVPQGSPNLSTAEIEHIEAVLREYDKFSARDLESSSHDESPWMDARAGLQPSDFGRKVITQEAMQAFFTAEMNA